MRNPSSGKLRVLLDDLPDQPILHRLTRTEPEVAVGVFLDALEWLTGLASEDPVEPVPHAENLPSLDLDVASRAARAAPGLVQEEAGVGKAEAAFERRRDEDQGARAGHPAGSHNPDAGRHEPDHVVDGVGRLHVPALRVQREGDVFIRLRRQRKELL
jgi:hypothetical protein